ncbi:UDP-N-acetylmuramate dehydrogenase [bacterium]|nr:UDP-N-acetylmuramate dehydrogenase [bacterium]
MTIETGVSLKDYTTFRTGGAAKFFARVKSVDDVKEAILFAKKEGIPFFVLGGGSNVLASDEGFHGLVIKIEIEARDFFDRAKKTLAIAGAGENWDDFVRETVAKNLSGLENLSLIPGTVGAAPIQNIGAYGREAKDTIEWVETFNTETLHTETLYNKECDFLYRDSIFKRPEGKKYIVARVAFSLTRNGIPSIEYKDVKEELAKQKIIIPTIQNVRDVVVAVRTAKLPNTKEVGTAGSFFKNPIVSEEALQEVRRKFPEVPAYPFGNGFKIPAGWLLDHVCNVKGERKGNVGAWGKQALVIVNYGDATTKEILEFAEDVKMQVKEKTEITLEYEVQRVS